ncbi:glycosyltransferase family 4 protein [Streptomyces armeniacus]|uniref:D-inositol 3-phosphate glycosyltransferase n=2 Tax=Streptomyces armeniacus TaxID=83291 RepID=A0A345Y1U9_9ACTN|nr:glycosyltransferase family 4 protein [Streptomyces armeniacus]
MRIRYLLLHAFGTGGTIRTVMNQANSLVAAGHDIEIVSVLRHRDEVRFPLDPRVRVTALIDERTAEAGTRSGGWKAALGARRDAILARTRPEHVPAGEFGVRYFNRYVEKVVAGYLREVTGDVLVSTRPALNILTARYAPRGLVRVAQEHMNLSVHRADVRKAIAEHYPQFDAVAVLTQRDRAEYAALLPRTRVVRIPNAVHSLEQRPADYDSKVVLAAGRLFPQKGFDLLLPAFRQVIERHPDWQLRIFGVGERKAELRALIEELHLYNHVFLMGHTSHLDDELAKASVYVLSSRFEGLPMVMIEAMAHALPVVGFDCPTGPSDVLTDGQEGILVPAEDTEALAGALSRLMGDRELREKLGTAALRTAQDYAPAEVHPQWESLFSELLTGRSGGSERGR